MLSQNNMQLPVWAWIVIVGLGIVGLVLGIWGFSSSFKTKKSSNKLILWNKVDKIKKTNEQKIYIIAFKIGNIDKSDDYFKPIYVFYTTELKSGLIDFIKKVEENKIQKINNYIVEQQVDNKLFYFEILETIDNQKQNKIDEKINKWVIEFDSKNRGFN